MPKGPSPAVVQMGMARKSQFVVGQAICIRIGAFRKEAATVVEVRDTQLVLDAGYGDPFVWEIPDCGDTGCRFAPRPLRGMRTQGGKCRCDE